MIPDILLLVVLIVIHLFFCIIQSLKDYYREEYTIKYRNKDSNDKEKERR